MKGKILTLTATFVFCYALLVSAEQAAPYLPYNSMGKQHLASMGKTVADSEKDIPSKETIGLPIYPGSYFGTKGTMNGALSTAQFLSKDSADKVIAWYKKQLGSGWQNVPELATKQLGEIAVFVKTDNPKISAMDSLSTQQIRIAQVKKPEDLGFVAMFFDVSGVKASINMQIKPMM